MNQYRPILIYFFVLVMSFNSIKSGVMLSFYLADTKSFVELFCVNKDKPEMKCEGKCELSKLAEQYPSNEKPTHLDFLQKEVLLYWSDLPDSRLKPKTFALETFDFYQNNYTYLFLKEISYPPAV